MSDWPKITALLITYKRTELAIRTIRAVDANLTYPGEIGWVVADDGSDGQHMDAIASTLAGLQNRPCPEPHFVVHNRAGVGRSMNRGTGACLNESDFILWLEDDWELQAPFDLTPCVGMLQERDDIGMVRLGYISPGIQGTLVSAAGRLWWKLHKGPTYTFTGHASLRHRRFCEAYGPYQEGLTPGETELYMCGTFNNKVGPDVALPAWTGEWGVFGHIGSESLKDMRPGT